MFKKFYIYLISLSTLVSIIFSFSKHDSNSYYYPIEDNNSISSYYGARQLFGKYNFHNGIDIPAVSNTPIHAIKNGIIKYVGFDAYGYGNYIVILHSNSYKSLYGHLSDNLLVNVGNNVSTGQVIAYVGPKILPNGKSNGNTTGSHLHLSIYSNDGKTVDPLSLIYKK